MKFYTHFSVFYVMLFRFCFRAFNRAWTASKRHQKTSYFRPETALEMTHHQSSADEFFVANLLDLSNDFAEEKIEQLDKHPNGFNTILCFNPEENGG
ncbi:hypothetical protein RDI58_005721 [Solanum bulbocastanum]|uniref:Uncharacterized protein n=1 Tax=Solanum bulbocastanum TaxID=147425 RepID=A0AAN8U3Q9_SOLBU